MKQKIFAHFLTTLSPLVLPGAVASAATVPPPASMYENPVASQLSIDSIPCLLLALVDLVFLIAGPVIVMCIIYGGFLFVTAQGNETKITKARTVLIWTLVGAGVLLSAKAISLAIQATLVSVGASGATGPLCP